jgi:hypothetical protein
MFSSAPKRQIAIPYANNSMLGFPQVLMLIVFSTFVRAFISIEHSQSHACRNGRQHCVLVVTCSARKALVRPLANELRTFQVVRSTCERQHPESSEPFQQGLLLRDRDSYLNAVRALLGLADCFDTYGLSCSTIYCSLASSICLCEQLMTSNQETVQRR